MNKEPGSEIDKRKYDGDKDLLEFPKVEVSLQNAKTEQLFHAYSSRETVGMNEEKAKVTTITHGAMTSLIDKDTDIKYYDTLTSSYIGNSFKVSELKMMLDSFHEHLVTHK